MSKVFTIGLLLEARESYAAAFADGVQAYCAGQADLLVNPNAMRSTPAGDFDVRRIDGIIALPATEASVQRVEQTQIPVVYVGWRESLLARAVVMNDAAAAGAMAAEFLIERGFRHFAFVGFERHFSAARQSGFVDRVRATDRTACAVFEGTADEPPPVEEAVGFMSWLRGLPRPVGIVAANDRFGRWTVECARRSGIAVPGEAAVVGIGNNLVECALSVPALSSVVFDLPSLGWHAAAALHRQLRGQPPGPPVMVRPLEVKARASSDVMAFADPRLNRVLSYLRRHSGKNIGIEDVLREFPMSRKTLFNLFRRSLGRTAAQEIVRLRVLEAASLLRRTHWSMERVAEASGFGEARRMERAFRTHFGQSARSFRAEYRALP